MLPIEGFCVYNVLTQVDQDMCVHWVVFSVEVAHISLEREVKIGIKNGYSPMLPI